MRNTKPKIAVIGAGSASFGLANLGAIMRTANLKGSTLALCDLNSEGLDAIFRLAQRINGEWGSEFVIEASENRDDVLKDANFVIISVAIDREKCWKADHELGKRYGILHYAENGGPGGFFHAARNIPIVLPILQDIDRLCPDAWVLNFTNPMTRICTAAARYSGVQCIGICHQIDFGYMMAGRLLGPSLGLNVRKDYLFRWDRDPEEHRIADLARERLDILAAGINHFTWFLSIRDRLTGEELLGQFYEKLLGQTEFEPYSRAILAAFGCVPVSGDAHLLEYLPYTSNISRGGWKRYDIQMYPLDIQSDNRERMWTMIHDAASGKIPIEPLRHVRSERSELLIGALWDGEPLYDYAVNLPNDKLYIANMPRDSIIEVPAVITQNKVQGISVGNLPAIAASLCRRQSEIVELSVIAAAQGDKTAALQAIALDPMIDDLDVAKNLLEEGLQCNKDYLTTFK